MNISNVYKRGSLCSICFMVTLTVIFLMVFPSARLHLTGAKLGLFHPDVHRLTILYAKKMMYTDYPSYLSKKIQRFW